MSCKLPFSVLFLPFLCFGGVTEKWVAETTEIEPHGFQAYHGETINMECTLTERGQIIRPSTGDAYFLWQTNGMEDAWWCTNANYHCGVVKTSFTPEMDPGGSAIQFFTLVNDRRGGNYRMNGEITMLRSPSGCYNILPYPVKELDFAKIRVLHPEDSPFELKGGGGGGSALPYSLAWTNGVVRTMDGSKTIGAADVGAVRTLQPATNYTDEVVGALNKVDVDASGNIYIVIP